MTAYVVDNKSGQLTYAPDLVSFHNPLWVVGCFMRFNVRWQSNEKQ